jgi:hypothetical protein
MVCAHGRQDEERLVSGLDPNMIWSHAGTLGRPGLRLPSRAGRLGRALGSPCCAETSADSWMLSPVSEDLARGEVPPATATAAAGAGPPALLRGAAVGCVVVRGESLDAGAPAGVSVFLAAGVTVGLAAGRSCASRAALSCSD